MVATVPARSRTRLLVPLLAGAGVVVLVIGTFLPWLRSGAAERNSYQAGGVIQRLIAPHGPLRLLLAVWPSVALVCAVAAAGYTIGFRRSALALASLASVAAGAVSIVALNAAPRPYASVTISGPAVTLAGATLVLAGAATAVLISSAARRSNR